MRHLAKKLSMMVVLGSFSSLSAQDINSIAQTVWINEDGSATIELDMHALFSDSTLTMHIPSEYSELSDFSVMLNGEPGAARVGLTLDRTSPVYEIQFNETLTDSHSITIRAENKVFMDWAEAGPEEFKTFNWGVTYTNTLPTTIDICKLTVILPDGWNFHRINGSEPQFKKKQPKPPYVFAMIDDRASVSISRKPMQYMEQVSIDFAFKNEQKPNVLIYAGILLSLLYLYNFRHLVLGRDAGNKNDSKESKQEK